MDKQNLRLILFHILDHLVRHSTLRDAYTLDA